MAKRDEAGAESKPMSVAEIAATLVNPDPEAAEAYADDVEEHNPEAEVEDDAEEISPTGGEDDDEEDTSELETETGEQEEEQPNEDDDETEYLDIRDEDIITVMVDGEEQEVSIGELKKAHSGEGAIEKRLQEATEIRKAAAAERVTVLETLAENERQLLEALDGLDDNLFKGVIPPPSDELRRTNPDQYLRHQEAYQQDQARISDAKKLIEDKKAEVAQTRQKRLEAFAKEAAPIIAREIPELADPKTAPAMFEQLAQTAMSYGYSEAEVNNALDPRMYMLVRDAMKYRKLMDKTKERDPKDLSKHTAKKVRRLRTGNTSAKTRARQSDQKRQAAVAKAQKTGSVKDVAATLINT